MTELIRFSGQAEEVINYANPDDLWYNVDTALRKHIQNYVNEFGTELFVKDLYQQNLRGEFRVTLDQIVTIDPVKLEEFDRILREEAFLRNLVVTRQDNHDQSITIRWMPREEATDG